MRLSLGLSNDAVSAISPQLFIFDQNGGFSKLIFDELTCKIIGTFTARYPYPTGIR